MSRVYTKNAQLQGARRRSYWTYEAEERNAADGHFSCKPFGARATAEGGAGAPLAGMRPRSRMRMRRPAVALSMRLRWPIPLRGSLGPHSGAFPGWPALSRRLRRGSTIRCAPLRAQHRSVAPRHVGSGGEHWLALAFPCAAYVSLHCARFEAQRCASRPGKSRRCPVEFFNSLLAS